MTSDLRRQLILSAAKRCFARNGFAGTTTKSVAAAASISEGLLFKHFPTKSALYAEILAEECEADPALHRLLGLEPSTETLVVLIREMVRHFMQIADAPDQQEAQRLRLMITSHLDDGEFARLIYEKIGDLIGPVFTASLERAVAAGDASRVGREPLNLFWFAHHTVLMAALGAAALRSVPVLRQCRRSRTAALRIHSPRNWTERNRDCLPSGSRTVAGSGTAGNCRRCMT